MHLVCGCARMSCCGTHCLTSTLAGSSPSPADSSHFQMTASRSRANTERNTRRFSALIWLGLTGHVARGSYLHVHRSVPRSPVDPKETRTTPSGWLSMKCCRSGGRGWPGRQWMPPISIVFGAQVYITQLISWNRYRIRMKRSVLT